MANNYVLLTLLDMLYIVEALFVFCVDVLFPTSDTITDLITVYSIIENGYSEAACWVISMILPILINVGFT